jgi:hypothetical protein
MRLVVKTPGFAEAITDAFPVNSTPAFYLYHSPVSLQPLAASALATRLDAINLLEPGGIAVGFFLDGEENAGTPFTSGL